MKKIAQIVFIINPLKWLFIPIKQRVKPDFLICDNYYRFKFLFFELTIHFNNNYHLTNK